MSGTADSITGFLLLLAAGLALEWRARRLPERPTAARCLASTMRTTPGRVAVLAWWVWLGIHFLAR